MSLTGNDVLALIERTLTDTRSEIGNIERTAVRARRPSSSVSNRRRLAA